MATDSASALAPDQRLAKGTLTLPDAIAISVSVIAPGMAAFLNVPGVAGTAGGSTPLAFLLGGIGCLALAFVVIGFTRRMASAGYAYTYASRSLGKSSGFMAGWLYAFGLACFVPMTMAGVSYLFCDLVGLGTSWLFPVFLVGMVLLVALSIVRIKVTTRLQLLVGLVTVGVIVVICLITIAKGGAHGNSGAPFTFSHTVSGGFHGVYYGIILAVTSFIGFETAADFGEETKNPRRNIPVAIIAATTFAILFYLLVTYAMSIGVGVNNSQVYSQQQNLLNVIANRYVTSWVGTLTEVGAMLSAFIVCVACATASTRTVYAMGREGVLPRFFGHTHPRFRTPVNATIAVALVAVVMALISWFGMSDQLTGSSSVGAPLRTYFFWATLGTLAVVVVYIGLCLGGIAFFRRTHRNWNPLAHVLVPLVGAVVFGAALYSSVYPVPAHPLNYTFYVALAWIAIGIIVVLVLRARNPEAVERIGSILGEEGGDDAAELDAGPAAFGTAAPTAT
jgi:amino acid transporter